MKSLNDKSDIQWESLSGEELFSKLKDDPMYLANKEMAKRVVGNVRDAVNHYLGPMSEKLLEKLNMIMGKDVYADYFIFLGRPFELEFGTPHWHAVSLYKAMHCSLKSYTSRISCRYFYKQAKKEKDNNAEMLIDFCDYESLLKCDQPEEEEDNSSLKFIKKAFEQLSERDQMVIQCLVIDKMEGLEAYQILKQFVHPRPKGSLSGEEIKEGWTTKQKQDVVSLMKGRALKHLLENYNELQKKTNEYED